MNTELSNAETAIDTFNTGHQEAKALLSQGSSLTGTIYFSILQAPDTTAASKQLGGQLAQQIQQANGFLQAARQSYEGALETTNTANNALSRISAELNKGRAHRSNQKSSETLIQEATEINREVTITRNGMQGMSIYQGRTTQAALNEGSRILQNVAENLEKHLS